MLFVYENANVWHLSADCAGRTASADVSLCPCAERYNLPALLPPPLRRMRRRAAELPSSGLLARPIQTSFSLNSPLAATSDAKCTPVLRSSRRFSYFIARMQRRGIRSSRECARDSDTAWREARTTPTFTYSAIEHNDGPRRRCRSWKLASIRAARRLFQLSARSVRFCFLISANDGS